MQGILAERVSVGSVDITMATQLSAWIQDHVRNVPHYLFVLSLSANGSLLSQWRSYTPHGKGVSVAVSQEMVASIAQANDMLIAKCLYRSEEQKVLMGSLLKYLEDRRQEPDNQEIVRQHAHGNWGLFERYKGEILRTMAIIKHPAFSEEDEWRLISRHSPDYKSDARIRYREGAAMLAPYIELSFPDSGSLFESVTIGPHPRANLAIHSLGEYLSREGVCDEVKNCGIPFRQW